MSEDPPAINSKLSYRGHLVTVVAHTDTPGRIWVASLNYGLVLGNGYMIDYRERNVLRRG